MTKQQAIEQLTAFCLSNLNLNLSFDQAERILDYAVDSDEDEAGHKWGLGMNPPMNKKGKCEWTQE